MNKLNNVKKVDQVIPNLSIFNLNAEEKEIFFNAVNKLSKEVYKRGETNSSRFVQAIDEGNTEVAFKLIQRLSWRYPAVIILREVKKIMKIGEENSLEARCDSLYNFAYKYGNADKQPTISTCENCGHLITSYDTVCPSCHDLTDVY